VSSPRTHGQLVRSYRLIERIGAGALGEVWRARHEKIGRDVAIKFIVPNWTIEKPSLAAFLADATASGRLGESSVIELLDQGEVDGVPFVVMKYIEAEKLDDLIARRGPLPIGTALRLVGDLAQGVAAAHEQGLFHLRIEPANVLLHRDARGMAAPKLIDFGVAHLVGDRRRLELVGPVAYFAPEQAEGEEGDGRSDVWSMAVLLYHMLVGHPPFEAMTPSDLQKELDEATKTAVARAKQLDPKIGALLQDSLARHRARRPLMRQFARRVRDLATGRPDGRVALAGELEIAETIEPSELLTVAPMPPPVPPPRVPRLPTPPLPMIAQPRAKSSKEASSPRSKGSSPPSKTPSKRPSKSPSKRPSKRASDMPSVPVDVNDDDL